MDDTERQIERLELMLNGLDQDFDGLVFIDDRDRLIEVEECMAALAMDGVLDDALRWRLRTLLKAHKLVSKWNRINRQKGASGR